MASLSDKIAAFQCGDTCIALPISSALKYRQIFVKICMAPLSFSLLMISRNSMCSNRPGLNTILFPTFSSLTEVEGNFRKSNEINETVVDEEACDDVDTKLEDDVESDFETPSVEAPMVEIDPGPDHCRDLERVIIGVDRLRSDSNPESKSTFFGTS